MKLASHCITTRTCARSQDSLFPVRGARCRRCYVCRVALRVPHRARNWLPGTKPCVAGGSLSLGRPRITSAGSRADSHRHNWPSRPLGALGVRVGRQKRPFGRRPTHSIARLGIHRAQRLRPTDPCMHRQRYGARHAARFVLAVQPSRARGKQRCAPALPQSLVPTTGMTPYTRTNRPRTLETRGLGD